jgi:preprotein translocase subunit SecD
VATTSTGHPGRTLIVLAALIAGLFGLIAAGDTWAPKLGLDLRGGTTITLTAKNTTGTGAVDPNSLELARTIIQSRVDSLGVGESEVTTAGDRQLIVTVPNVQRDQLVELVGQTALLRFRAVYAAEQVTPPPAAHGLAPAVRRADAVDKRGARAHPGRQQQAVPGPAHRAAEAGR